MSLNYGNIIKLSNGYLYLVTNKFEYELSDYYVLTGTSGENLEILFVTCEEENGKDVIYQITDDNMNKNLFEFWCRKFA